MVNEAHRVCGSDEWRQLIRDTILPWALGETDLGDDVLEVGPGYGAITDVLCTAAGRVTAVEIDSQLAALLRDRFQAAASVHIVDGDATRMDFPDETFSGAACFTMLHHVPTSEQQNLLFSEVARVPRPGAALVAADSLGSDELAAMHTGDTYHPVDPTMLAGRLLDAGFGHVEVKTNEFGWAAIARKAPA
jgi:ubiquinone/menaquinone biosynthesis C-methylase UbiE